MTGHFGCFHRGLAEVAQPLQAHPRLLDVGRRGGCRFHLAHLPAQHVIGCFQVAGEIDAAHIGALAGVDEKLHRHRVVFLVDLGNAADLGEVVAIVAQPAGEILLGGGDQLLGKYLPLSHQQEPLQVRLG